MVDKLFLQVTGVKDAELEARQRAEVRFFTQSVVNVIILLTNNICYDLISRLATTKWENYWTTILPWLAGSASNG